MSTPPPTHRPLDAWIVLALTLLTVGVMEAWMRANWHARGGLSEKAAAFSAQAQADAKNLVVIGTCLPEQHIQSTLLADRLGGGWHVYNLGSEATNPLDWYMAVAHRIPLDRVDALVVAYGADDLEVQITPWESRVTEVATWSDMPALLTQSCSDTTCQADLFLRKASSMWRYRERVANLVWAGLGGASDGVAERPPPVGAGRPGAPLFYVGRLLEVARDAGIPAFMLPLPRRPDTRTPRPHPEEAVVAEAGGAATLVLPQPDASLYSDDTHLTSEGSVIVTRAVAAVLRGPLGLSEPPEHPDAPPGLPWGPKPPPGSTAAATPSGPPLSPPPTGAPRASDAASSHERGSGTP